MRSIRTAALFAPFAAALLLAPAPAFAHDVLIDSNPEDGAALDTVPEEVVLTFNNSPLAGGSGSAIVVTGPDGAENQEGELEFDGTDVSVGLSPLGEPGEYSIAYRVVSSDGHPIQDTLTFSVSEEAVAAAAPEEPEEDPAGAEEEVPAEDAETIDDSAATAENTAAEESGTSPMMVLAGIVAAVAGLGAIVLVAVRLRNRPGAGSDKGSGPDSSQK
ncbi:copper resistance protein CopC [Nocardiopsis exhalans]|uniref:Copper resistance protein CopC n=1 Tax=Nocardiopsis exhalans TaxID=163604 RepID=A0ABY5DDN0_9ACTN|nr:copper resistance CopC family protein [Nocardiopsis exhalans]USY21191.1 copper resistance protein CopC [Nocardiopsis exhalans]